MTALKKGWTMRLTMNERGAVIEGFAQQCRRAGKKRKGRILDQVVEAAGYVRRYAARRLRNQGRRLCLGNGVVLEALQEAKSELWRAPDDRPVVDERDDVHFGPEVGADQGIDS